MPVDVLALLEHFTVVFTMPVALTPSYILSMSRVSSKSNTTNFPGIGLFAIRQVQDIKLDIVFFDKSYQLFCIIEFSIPFDSHVFD